VHQWRQSWIAVGEAAELVDVRATEGFVGSFWAEEMVLLLDALTDP